MARRYGKKASKKVEKAMRERKEGTLRSGSTGEKVTSREQAIAIGLSEARRSGAKVPKKRSSKKKTSRKTSSRSKSAGSRKSSSSKRKSTGKSTRKSTKGKSRRKSSKKK